MHSSSNARLPLVWLLLGHKAGDNGQIRALASALGWPAVEKHLHYRDTELLSNLTCGPNLLGLNGSRSSALEPPWPDLILTAGRRNEPIARWVQARAGGRAVTKIVHIGRPWAPLPLFDLVITTRQYFLPEAPNVLVNEAPLHLLTSARLKEAAAVWMARLEHLPRPRIAVLMGGDSGPYTFDRENAALLGWHANAMARSLGGSVLATSSARTRPAAVDAFTEQITVSARIHRWAPDAHDNPYLGFLAQADRVIVTGDSMSMLAEACETGAPVFIFDLARGRGSRRPTMPADGRVRRRSLGERVASFRPSGLGFHLTRLIGPRQLARDVRRIHLHQVAAGRAAWLGEDAPTGKGPPPIDDLARSLAATRTLMHGDGGTIEMKH